MLPPFALGVRQPQPSHAVTLPNGFARKTARNGQAMFNVVARNGEIVGASKTCSGPSVRERGISVVIHR